jgi:hypothetical protein
VVNGVPRGMFFGRSLLTGRAVCLLFLSNGRITRFIPTGGLDRFDWTKHRTDHPGDSGTWEIRGGQLRVTWGDGGVHEGPIKENPNGIEFSGKRYARAVSVPVSALVGSWEAARGTAIVGGSGVNTVSTLVVRGDGRYQWSAVTGGAVAGRAAVGEKAMTGDPVVAFTADGDAFTRVR